MSIQDGVAAGQSVPHVHVHILPRRTTDFEGVNDRVYSALEEAEQGLADDLVNKHSHQILGSTARWAPPRDEDRKSRGEEEMAEEAGWLSNFFHDA